MEEMSLFNYVVTVLQFAVMYCAFDYMLNRRCKAWIVAVADFAALNALYFVLLLVTPTRLTFARLPLGFIILCAPLLLYENKWYHKLLAFAAAQCVLVLAELIMAFFDKYSVFIFTSGVESWSVVERIPRYASYIFIYTVLMLLLCAVVQRHKKTSIGNLSAREILIAALFFLCQCILLSGAALAAYSANMWHKTVILLAVFASFASYVSVFVLMLKLANRRVLMAENESLTRQMSAQRDYYDIFLSQSESIRRMRHDIANHLFTIDAMLSNGELDEAKKYSRELQADGVVKPSLGLCLNSAVDAFLSARFALLEDKDIRVDAAVSVPAELGISDVDLISAFGNLLDNAVEALQKEDNKLITLQAYTQGAYLVISTENPCTQGRGAHSAARRIPELERGVGFRIMNRLADKYDGQFKYELEDNVFRASLILKKET